MYSFCDEEKAELLPKNRTRIAKMRLENYEHTSARVNIWTLYPDLPNDMKTLGHHPVSSIGRMQKSFKIYKPDIWGGRSPWGGGGKGDNPFYKPYRYVPPQTVGFFLGRFVLKTGTNFAHCGLEWGMVYEGTTVLYQRVRRFNSKWIKKKV